MGCLSGLVSAWMLAATCARGAVWSPGRVMGEPAPALPPTAKVPTSSRSFPPGFLPDPGLPGSFPPTPDTRRLPLRARQPRLSMTPAPRPLTQPSCSYWRGNILDKTARLSLNQLSSDLPVSGQVDAEVIFCHKSSFPVQAPKCI